MEHPFGCLNAVRANAAPFAFATRRFTFAVEFRPNVNTRRRRADDYYTDLASFSVVERLTAVKNHFFFIVASSHSDLKS